MCPQRQPSSIGFFATSPVHISPSVTERTDFGPYAVHTAPSGGLRTSGLQEVHRVEVFDRDDPQARQMRVKGPRVVLEVEELHAARL